MTSRRNRLAIRSANFVDDAAHIYAWHLLLDRAAKIRATKNLGLAAFWRAFENADYDKAAAIVAKYPLDAPIIKVDDYIQAGRTVYSIVVQCPLCPDTHTHGMGLGGRSGHCISDSANYIVTDPQGLLAKKGWTC